jgi:hypothetical protein
LRGRPRNRWQDKVRENGRKVDGERLAGKSMKQRGKLLRMAVNCHFLHMPVGWMDE